jgi:DNA-binding MarR family transcriptional regulator
MHGPRMKGSNGAASAASAIETADSAADVDLSALEQIIGFRIRMIDLAMHQSFYDRFSDRAFTPAIFSALTAIRQNPGIRHGALADALRIQRPNMTSLLNALTRMGYVSRRASADDKRSVALHLTERGEKAAAKMHTAMQAFDRDMTAGLSPQERKTLLALLGKALPAGR